MNQWLYDDWLSKFNVTESQTFLNINNQITQIWQAGGSWLYITNNEWISDKPAIRFYKDEKS